MKAKFLHKKENTIDNQGNFFKEINNIVVTKWLKN